MKFKACTLDIDYVVVYRCLPERKYCLMLVYSCIVRYKPHKDMCMIFQANFESAYKDSIVIMNMQT